MHTTVSENEISVALHGNKKNTLLFLWSAFDNQTPNSILRPQKGRMEDKIKEGNLRYPITFFFHFSPEAPHPQVKLKPWRYVHL